MKLTLFGKSYVNDEFPEEHVPTVLDCYKTEVNVNDSIIKV